MTNHHSKETIQQELSNKMLVDFMLLHGYMVDNPGLMTGKAGIMLSLFEASHIDKRKIIEETAFDLLKEVLAWNLEEYSFKKGKAGIACALLYIIENDFIDCDFNELYGIELQEIFRYIKGLRIKETNIEECIGYLVFLFNIKKEISIDDFKEILNVLLSIIFDYYQFVPANPIEIQFFYSSAAKIFTIYNFSFDRDNHYLDNIINSIIYIHEQLEKKDYICMNLKFAFHFFCYSKKYQEKKTLLSSQSLINNILQNTINNTMSIEEAIDSYYIMNQLYKEEKNPFQVEHIYRWMDSLFTYGNFINKKKPLWQVKPSSLASLEYGIPKLMLIRCIFNKERILENRIVKLFI